MNKTIGKCATHEKAIEAILELKRSGYPVEKVSLVGKAVIVDDHLYVTNNKWLKNIPAIVGAVLGPILGILIGLKIIAFPGFGFLFGVGAKIGALAGFSIGIAAGGIVSLISILVFKSRHFLNYDEHSKEQSFRVIAYGSTEEVNRAKTILDDFID
jgi:uncharacterized membrane protein